MKLSEMWERASKELIQIRDDMGNPSRKRACALGAIIYYMSNGYSCRDLLPIKEREYLNLISEFENKSGKDIVSFNDIFNWAFQDFANEAKRIGM